jgi:hypothetical protein
VSGGGGVSLAHENDGEVAMDVIVRGHELGDLIRERRQRLSEERSGGVARAAADRVSNSHAW